MAKLFKFALVVTGMLVFTAPLSLSQHHDEAVVREKGPEHQVPKSYAACMSRLEALTDQLNELALQSRFFQMHNPLELLEAIVVVIPAKLEHDVCDRLRDLVAREASKLSGLADKLDSYADNEEASAFWDALAGLAPSIVSLEAFAALSNEEPIDVTVHNVPNTYGRCMNRLNGLNNALIEVGVKKYLHDSHELTEHLKDIANTISTIAETNLIVPLIQEAEKNKKEILFHSSRLHDAADIDDPAPFVSDLPDIVMDIRDIKKLSDKVNAALSGKLQNALLSSNASVSVLLAHANKYRKKLQLINPASANAYDLYKKILEIDPENAQAKDGLQKILEWYVHHARDHEKKGEFTKAGIYYQRALTVEPSSREAREGLERVKRN